MVNIIFYYIYFIYIFAEMYNCGLLSLFMYGVSESKNNHKQMRQKRLLPLPERESKVVGKGR